MRDDLPAIADSGYNLTVAELRAGDAAAALRDARALRAELARAGYGDLPALDLVEATAAYRLGDSDQADQVAATVQACSDRDAAAQAVFLRGLIADERGDLQGLQQESHVWRTQVRPVTLRSWRLAFTCGLAMRPAPAPWRCKRSIRGAWHRTIAAWRAPWRWPPKRLGERETTAWLPICSCAQAAAQELRVICARPGRGSQRPVRWARTPCSARP